MATKVIDNTNQTGFIEFIKSRIDEEYIKKLDNVNDFNSFIYLIIDDRYLKHQIKKMSFNNFLNFIKDEYKKTDFKNSHLNNPNDDLQYHNFLLKINTLLRDKTEELKAKINDIDIDTTVDKQYLNTPFNINIINEKENEKIENPNLKNSTIKLLDYIINNFENCIKINNKVLEDGKSTDEKNGIADITVITCETDENAGPVPVVTPGVKVEKDVTPGVKVEEDNIYLKKKNSDGSTEKINIISDWFFKHYGGITNFDIINYIKNYIKQLYNFKQKNILSKMSSFTNNLINNKVNDEYNNIINDLYENISNNNSIFDRIIKVLKTFNENFKNNPNYYINIYFNNEDKDNFIKKYNISSFPDFVKSKMENNDFLDIIIKQLIEFLNYLKDKLPNISSDDVLKRSIETKINKLILELNIITPTPTVVGGNRKSREKKSAKKAAKKSGKTPAKKATKKAQRKRRTIKRNKLPKSTSSKSKKKIIIMDANQTLIH
jgi:hypothetical protein